jgi:hypothetical protein
MSATVRRGKPRQNVAKLVDVLRVYAARVVVLMKALQSFVPYRLNHSVM